MFIEKKLKIAKQYDLSQVLIAFVLTSNCHIQVNADYLEKKFEALTSKELIAFKDDLNRFFSKCAEYIVSDNIIRMINAVQVSFASPNSV